MIEDRDKPDMPVCRMCRAALHKLCEKEGCTCECQRGY